MESKKNNRSDIINGIIVVVVLLFVAIACVLAVVAIKDNKEAQQIAEEDRLDSTESNQLSGLVQFNKEEIEREFVIAYIIEETVEPEQLTKLAMLFQERTRDYYSDAFIQYGAYEGKVLIGVRLPEEEQEIVSEDTREHLAQRLIQECDLRFVLDYNTDHERTILDGGDIQEAMGSQYKDEFGIEDYIVEIQFTEQGGAIFEKETREHIGEIIWIIYDGNPICTPRVNAAISGGKAILNGLADEQEANSIANAINLIPFDYTFTRIR